MFASNADVFSLMLIVGASLLISFWLIYAVRNSLLVWPDFRQNRKEVRLLKYVCLASIHLNKILPDERRHVVYIAMHPG